jgi:transcriptional regulator with XRE-family HTH domain
MPLKQKLADIITTERKNKGLTQDKVAANSDLSNRYYRSIEAGEKMASINSAFKIAKGLGVHYSTILEPVWEYWQEHPETAQGEE